MVFPSEIWKDHLRTLSYQKCIRNTGKVVFVTSNRDAPSKWILKSAFGYADPKPSIVNLPWHPELSITSSIMITKFLIDANSHFNTFINIYRLSKPSKINTYLSKRVTTRNTMKRIARIISTILIRHIIELFKLITKLCISNNVPVDIHIYQYFKMNFRQQSYSNINPILY